MAEGPGFEPGLTGPEPVVLPLDDPSTDYCRQIHKCIIPVKTISMFLAQNKEPLAHAKFGHKGNIILKRLRTG